MALNIARKIKFLPASGRTIWMGLIANRENEVAQSSAKKSKDHVPTPPEAPKTDSTKYNVAEYFSYSEYSYYDIDRDCVSMRIKQPEAPIDHR